MTTGGRPARLVTAFPPCCALARCVACLALLATVAGADPVESYRVGPDDVLAVVVNAAGAKQDEFVVSVSSAGSIDCPLVGVVDVAGLPLREIALRLEHEFRRGFYVDPVVDVQVRECGGRISISGEVQRPGTSAVRPGLTVEAACELAGGLSDFAAPRRVRIYRRTNQGPPRQLLLDLLRVRQGRAEDLALERGDRVEVPRRWF